MNSNSPVATGAAALSGAMLGPVVIWFCTAIHVTPPPPDVAATIGIALLTIGHSAVNYFTKPAATPATPEGTKT